MLAQYTGGRLVSLGDGRARDAFGVRVPITREFLEEKDALVRPGDILWGHLTPSAERLRLLEERGYVIFLMLRDPRDVVCSRVAQALSLQHDHYHEAVSSLATQEDRINQVIHHFPYFDGPSIGDIFRQYRRWEAPGGVVTLRYERLVGPAGGGSQEAQLREMLRIEDRFGLVGIPGIYRRIVGRRVYDHQGRIGRHSELFTQGNHAVFDEVFDPALLAWARGESDESPSAETRDGLSRSA